MKLIARLYWQRSQYSDKQETLSMIDDVDAASIYEEEKNKHKQIHASVWFYFLIYMSSMKLLSTLKYPLCDHIWLKMRVAGTGFYCHTLHYVHEAIAHDPVVDTVAAKMGKSFFFFFFFQSVPFIYHSSVCAHAYVCIHIVKCHCPVLHNDCSMWFLSDCCLLAVSGKGGFRHLRPESVNSELSSRWV